MTETGKNIELRKYQRILQFKFSRETSLVHDAYRSLILSAVYEQDVKSIPEINEVLKNSFGIEPLPFHFVQKYLEELKKEGKILYEKGKYVLAESVRGELELVGEKRTRLKELIDKNIIGTLKSRFSLEKKKEKELTELFNEIISSFFTQSARLFSGYLVENGDKKLVFDIPVLETIIEDKAQLLVDKDLREAFKESVKEEIKKGTTFFYDCLYDIFQIYVCFEILSADPELKIRSGIKRVYLDTNFLLDLLIPSRNRHHIAVDCVKLSREMNIKNMFTYLTSIELQTLIREYRTAEKLDEKILEMLVKSDNGGLIKAFFIEKKANPSLTFEGYCIGFQKSFQRCLKEEFGVKFDSSKYPEDTGKAKELEPLVEKVASKILHEYKSKQAVVHDAFCLQLQRTKESSLFVTCDKTLFVVSKILMEQGTISKPLSVESSVWLSALTFIRPPSNGETSVEAFKEFMLAPLTSSLRPISMNKLLVVAFPWLKEEYLTPEDLGDIISRKFIEDHIIKPQEDEIGAIVTAEDLIPRMIDEKLKEKMEKLNEENEDLKKAAEAEKKKIETVEKKYQDAMANPIKIKALFLIGLICIITLGLFVVCSVFLSFDIPDVAYYSFTVLAIIFIGASIFGEKVYELAKVR